MFSPFRLTCLLSIAVLSSGCHAIPRRDATEIEQPSVQKILSMWQATQQNDSEGIPQVGYAGQLWFLGEDPVPHAVSALVTLLIYEQRGADWVLQQEYKYTPEAWATHKRETALGIVYNVFLPYKSEHKSALRTQYINENGKPVFSDLFVLTGRIAEDPSVAQVPPESTAAP